MKKALFILLGALAVSPLSYAAKNDILSAAKTLPLTEADRLMRSSEASAWEVFRVTAPENGPDCRRAKKFAEKFNAQIACSTLYPLATVWLAPVVPSVVGSMPERSQPIDVKWGTLRWQGSSVQ